MIKNIPHQHQKKYNIYLKHSHKQHKTKACGTLKSPKIKYTPKLNLYMSKIK